MGGAGCPARFEKGWGKKGAFARRRGRRTWGKERGKERVRTPKARTSACVKKGAGPRRKDLLGGPEQGEGLGKRGFQVLRGRSL